ncbi:hypothetical protein VP01_1503g3 [Puccinia sorghi]|uniref:Uncharacterized protein n=1 Tax=Puccinia sorghi TaxID=27349 RepID=A0A0L6VJ78_9BASI|nr:hypothetical protein VP01_1503g3 [Puccinia sorghi]
MEKIQHINRLQTSFSLKTNDHEFNSSLNIFSGRIWVLFRCGETAVLIRCFLGAWEYDAMGCLWHICCGDRNARIFKEEKAQAISTGCFPFASLFFIAFVSFSLKNLWGVCILLFSVYLLCYPIFPQCNQRVPKNNGERLSVPHILAPKLPLLCAGFKYSFYNFFSGHLLPFSTHLGMLVKVRVCTTASAEVHGLHDIFTATFPQICARAVLSCARLYLPGVSPTGGLSSASAPLYIPQLAIYHLNHNITQANYSQMGVLSHTLLSSLSQKYTYKSTIQHPQQWPYPTKLFHHILNTVFIYFYNPTHGTQVQFMLIFIHFYILHPHLPLANTNVLGSIPTLRKYKEGQHLRSQPSL